MYECPFKIIEDNNEEGKKEQVIWYLEAEPKQQRLFTSGAEMAKYMTKRYEIVWKNDKIKNNIGNRQKLRLLLQRLPSRMR